VIFLDNHRSGARSGSYVHDDGGQETRAKHAPIPHGKSAGSPASKSTSIHAFPPLSAFALAMGRHGVDAPTESPEMGSVVEHMLRRGETNVLVTSRTWSPAESDALNSEIAA
jgi:hypothetical protein